MIYDVIIVGAGSNGATAAYFLAKKGFEILLIERGKNPGDKCHGATEYCPAVIFHSMPELIELQKKSHTTSSASPSWRPRLSPLLLLR